MSENENTDARESENVSESENENASESENENASESAGDSASENDVLSKDEVGALLTGVADGVVPTNGGIAASGEVRAFDYKSSANVSSYCPDSLVNIYTQAARQLQSSLYGLLRKDLSVELDGVRKHRYDEYIATLDDPLCIYTITEQSLPGTALIVLDSALVYAFVDHYFGGLGMTREEADPTERRITASEALMSRKLLDLLMTKLAEAWSVVKEVEFAFSGFETDPSMVTVAAPSTSMMVVNYKIELADTATSCHVVMPLSMLAPVRPLLEASGQGSLAKREQFHSAMQRSLKGVKVELHSTLCEVNLTLRELLSLMPGDIIPVDLPANVQVCANGESVLYGRYGRSRGLDAIMVAGRATSLQSSQH